MVMSILTSSDDKSVSGTEPAHKSQTVCNKLYVSTFQLITLGADGAKYVVPVGFA